MRNQTSLTNYGYDALGNVIKDVYAGITNIGWTVYNKPDTIYKSSGNIIYTYNTANQRVSKTIGGITTWYVRDAQGNVLALYDNVHGNNNWREQHLYGPSRLAMWMPNMNMATNNSVAIWDSVGKKQYELDNHLGNVMTTVTDKRLQHSTSGTSIDYYLADVASAQDYYPFGMLQPGRQYTFGSDSTYRYGFNGKENDNTIMGVGNSQDYGERQYDPRIGRFRSVDPIAKQYPELSSYQFASNSPVFGIDRDGKELAGNTWLLDIWLDWKYGDPTGAKTLVSGIGEKTAIASGQVSYHNPYVPPTVQNKLDHINNIQASAKIIKGSAKVIAFNLKTGIEVATAIVPIGEEVEISLEGIETVYNGIKAERALIGSSDKIAVIGRQFDERVLEFAAGFEKQTSKAIETFNPSSDAITEWSGLLKEYNQSVPEEITKTSKLYKENLQWAQKIKREGYHVFDTGLGKYKTKGTFYGLETKLIFGDK